MGDLLRDGRRGGGIGYVVVAFHLGVVEGRGRKLRRVFVEWTYAELVLIISVLDWEWIDVVELLSIVVCGLFVGLFVS